MDYMVNFKDEKKYSLRDVSIILLVCMLVVLIFDATGLYLWAKRLNIGSTRNFFIDTTEPLYSVTSKMKLDFPRNIFKKSFDFAMGKEREAGWIAASDETYISQTSTQSEQITEIASTHVVPDNTNTVVYTLSSPLSVLLIGDSMMGDGLGTMLLRALNSDETMVPHRHYKVSSGLSRPDFYNWSAQIKQLYDQGNYDAVIIMMGTNDAQNFEMDRVIYNYGTDEWFGVYRTRLKNFIDTLCTYSDHIYWVGMPPMRSSGYNGRMQSLNTLFEEACRNNPKATYVSTIPVLGDVSGNYTTYITANGRQIQARGEDGIHMTRAGGQLVADEIIDLIKEDFTFGD